MPTRTTLSLSLYIVRSMQIKELEKLMTEIPKYSVTRKQKQIELRQYAGYIQAEVDIGEKD